MTVAAVTSAETDKAVAAVTSGEMDKPVVVAMEMADGVVAVVDKLAAEAESLEVLDTQAAEVHNSGPDKAWKAEASSGRLD